MTSTSRFFTCGPEIMQAYVASGAKFPELTIDLTQAGLDGTVYSPWHFRSAHCFERTDIL